MFNTKEKVEKLRLLSVRARQIYNYYTSLFIDERLDLLEQHGGSFFALVQVELEEALALKLAKLTDPAQQGKSNKNFTLETILKIANNESWQCKDQLQSIYDTDVDPKRRLIKKYRDKYLSHLDYGSTLNSSLTLPELAELEALLKSIEGFIKLAYAATHQADWQADTILNDSGVNDLVYAINYGHIYKQIKNSQPYAKSDYEEIQYGHPSFKME